MSQIKGDLDGSVKAKFMTFLQKLAADDTTPGLHIEPLKMAADARVRTGRVDDHWRAVLFRLDNNGEAHYVVHGVWNHDDAIAIATKTRLTVNPVNGLPQFEDAPTPVAADYSTPAANVEAPSSEPILIHWGRTREELVDRLGIPEDVADAALAAGDDDALQKLVEAHDGWLGMILLDLLSGDPVEAIIEKYDLARPRDTESDTDVIESFGKPAARAQFALVEGEDELRRVLDAGDFGAWRVFLHPEQRRYVDRDFNGPFRLSGGAGTGKTVVLMHRARRLSREHPTERIILTTFTTNLAESLRDGIEQLDPSVTLAPQLGEPGIFIASVDSIAAAVIRGAGEGITAAVTAVLGDPRSAVTTRTRSGRWAEVITATATSLAPAIANETFLEAEYALVVLPNSLTTEDEYLRVRRPGRGTPLDRAKRSAVWKLIEAYRAYGRTDGSLDFAEAAAVAAAYLDANPASRPADHVLVDEGQDLTPPQLRLNRALAGTGSNDLFLAEDSHQRIYGPKVVLSRFGISVVGRSRRLTLNYRTTAQNLHYAMSILEGGEYVDLDDEAETTGYRSVRTGPKPGLRSVSTLEDELELIVTTVREWLSQGAPPETIAVLVPDRYQRDRVTTRLAESEVPARSIDRERPPEGRVAVMTSHRAKGTEFAKVILTDIGFRSSNEQARLDALDQSERADAELRARSLHYVAATRARDELVVMTRPG
jgi:superfamily I DNA/RNA helicase